MLGEAEDETLEGAALKEGREAPTVTSAGGGGTRATIGVGREVAALGLLQQGGPLPCHYWRRRCAMIAGMLLWCMHRGGDGRRPHVCGRIGIDCTGAAGGQGSMWSKKPLQKCKTPLSQQRWPDAKGSH